MESLSRTSLNLRMHNAHAQCACVLSAGKMADLMYGHPRKAALNLRNTLVLEKTPHIFWPSSPAEFVTAFSGRTDAPEVRCDLTDTHTHTHTHTDRHDDYRNPRACAPRVNYKIVYYAVLL